MGRILLHAFVVAVLFLGALPLGERAIAEAQGQGNLNARLRGEYAWVASQACVNTSAGFGGSSGLELLPIPSGGFIFRNAHTLRGIIQFNGDGTATGTNRVTSLNINVGPPGIPITEFNGTCDWTYSVSADGSVTMERSCSATAVAGSGVGGFATVVEAEMKGQIVQGNTAIIFGPGDQPGVETLTSTPPGGPTTTLYRVCTRGGIISKTSPR